MFPLPDSRAGGGYGVNNGGMGTGHELKTSDIWPYIEITDLETDFDEDELEDEREEVDGKQMDALPIDPLWYKNQRGHAFVKSSTRGLTGIMAGLERTGSLLELLSGARGQAGMSYDVMSPTASTRTRPGRHVGSKRGYFQPHPPKPDDPSVSRFTLRDIADQEEDPLERAAMVKDRVKAKNIQAEGRNGILRSYIRLIACRI